MIFFIWSRVKYLSLFDPVQDLKPEFCSWKWYPENYFSLFFVFSGNRTYSGAVIWYTVTRMVNTQFHSHLQIKNSRFCSRLARVRQYYLAHLYVKPTNESNSTTIFWLTNCRALNLKAYLWTTSHWRKNGGVELLQNSWRWLNWNFELITFWSFMRSQASNFLLQNWNQNRHMHWGRI